MSSLGGKTSVCHYFKYNSYKVFVDLFYEDERFSMRLRKKEKEEEWVMSYDKIVVLHTGITMNIVEFMKIIDIMLDGTNDPIKKWNALNLPASTSISSRVKFGYFAFQLCGLASFQFNLKKQERCVTYRDEVFELVYYHSMKDHIPPHYFMVDVTYTDEKSRIEVIGGGKDKMWTVTKNAIERATFVSNGIVSSPFYEDPYVGKVKICKEYVTQSIKEDSDKAPYNTVSVRALKKVTIREDN